MIVSQLVFSWPREAQYSVDPTDYDGCPIEDYSLDILSTSLQVGDTRHWEGQTWTIAQIDEYSPQGNAGNTFSEVLLTLDGSIPQRESRTSNNTRLMYVCFNGEDFEIGWPTRSEFLPKVGDTVTGLEGYEISTVQEFDNSGIHTAFYDRVLVCWCAPSKVSEPELAIASA